MLRDKNTIEMRPLLRWLPGLSKAATLVLAILCVVAGTVTVVNVMYLLVYYWGPG